MSLLQYKKIIADRHRDEMIGRAGESERLLSHARGTGGGVAVSAAPRVGLTEIVQQAYDHLFSHGDRDGADIFPFRSHFGTGL
jgi:hypothetical protein